MEVVVMVYHSLHARWAEYFLHHLVIEKNNSCPWVIQEQTNQPDRCVLVVHLVPVGAASALPRQVVFAHRAAIHFNTHPMRLVPVKWLASVGANVPDPELPVTHRLPLPLDLENEGKHVGVGILRKLTCARHPCKFPYT